MQKIRLLKAAASAIVTLFSLLLVGAAIFYKERMLFVDAPHILFRIINEGSFQIAEQRYGSFITQIIPLIGAKLHFPLKTLLFLYSLSFNVFFLIIALLLIIKYKRYDLALLLGFYFTLFVSDTYYWTNNEVHQGVTWLMLAFAITWFSAYKKRPFLIVLLIQIIFFSLAIWTHPLVLLVAIYLWFFYLIDKREWPFTKWQSVFCSIILLIIGVLKFSQSLHHGYDSQKIEPVTRLSCQSVKYIFTAPQLKFFIKNCITHYWIFTSIYTIGMAALLKARKYLQFTWTLFFTAGYCLLLFATYHDMNSDAFRFYIESEYMPLSIIAAAPFVYYVLPFLHPKMMTGFLFSIFLIRLLYIGNSAPMFIKRLHFEETLVSKMSQKNYYKVIIPDSSAEANDALVLNWSMPEESMIISSLQKGQPLRTCIFLRPEEAAQDSSVEKYTMLAAFKKIMYLNLNAHYFKIDTNSNYHIVDYRVLIK